MRYYFALSIALGAMRYVLEKDYIRFVFFIGCAALFHKSVLLVLLVYWIAAFVWKRWVYVLGLLASAACFMGRGFLLKLALVLYPSYKNTIYLDGGMSLASVLRVALALGMYLWFVRYKGSAFTASADGRTIRFC